MLNLNINNYEAQVETISNVRKKYSKISVVPGVCRYNSRCQMNAVHDAINNNDENIIVCIAITEGYPCVHFINYTNDIYVDNTLGNWSLYCEYFFVEILDKKEYHNVNNHLIKWKKELRDKLSFWNKVLSNCEF